MTMFNVDCPECDANKTNDRLLFDHFLAVARADQAAEAIASKIATAQAAKEASNAGR